MKIREGFVLNEIGDTTLAIYVGEDENGLSGIVNLNRLGVFLWEKLTEGSTTEELVRAVTDRYDVDEATARKDIEAFVDSLRKENIFEE